MKRSFFGWGKPRLKCSVIGIQEKEGPAGIPLPAKSFIHVKEAFAGVDDLLIRLGTKVRTGQRLRLTSRSEGHFVSPVTGTIRSITPPAGYRGQASTSIAIEVTKDEWDEEFGKTERASSLKNARAFFDSLPGEPDFGSLLRYDPLPKTLVINGVDKDLFVITSQLAASTGGEDLARGIDALKGMIGAERMLLLVPFPLVDRVKAAGVEVKGVDPSYPSTLPRLLAKKVLGREVPVNGGFQDVGVGFVGAEAVSALGKAERSGLMPVEKILTVVGKEGSRVNARARIGTPVRDVLNALKVGAAHGDRVVIGGPMTGRPLLSEDTPVEYDTDAILVQDGTQIIRNSDAPCVNCGECVRACPARIPVNMLIRFLENGLWEEAADRYDLFSCVECGLCSYVCIARIPIFQHIMLGKYEYRRTKIAEESHA
jgi:electron transport complex protein RnfC